MSSRLMTRILTAGALALALQSCGGGGGGVASGGIGGTGVTSSGTISAFGSIWQNEVEYETIGAEFEVNDVVVETSASAGDDQTHFRRGMRIRITGSSSGATGTATRIVYDSDLKGPIASIAAVGTDGRYKDLTIYGKVVRLDRDNTLFDDTPPNVTFDTILVNDVVEISGLVDDAGRLVASYVELTDDLGSNPAPNVELQGTISGLSTGTNQFTIGTVTVNYADPPATTFVNVPGGDESGLANGQFVEIKGSHSGAATISASRIEIEGSLFGSNESEVEIEGIVTAFSDSSDFDITIDDNPANTINVDASGATELEPANLFVDGLVAAGTTLEVEGPIVAGTLIAREVKIRGNQVKVEAKVEFTGPNSITFRMTSVDTLTVNVDAQTQYRDDFGSPGLAQINIGDFLEVRGRWDGSTVTLTEVRRTDRDVAPADGLLDGGGDDVILQGPLDAPATAGGLSILGVGFTYDGAADFEDIDDSPFASAAAFVASPNNRTGAIVKVKDDQNVVGSGLGDNDADEVEYEN